MKLTAIIKLPAALATSTVLVALGLVGVTTAATAGVIVLGSNAVAPPRDGRQADRNSSFAIAPVTGSPVIVPSRRAETPRHLSTPPANSASTRAITATPKATGLPSPQPIAVVPPAPASLPTPGYAEVSLLLKPKSIPTATLPALALPVLALPVTGATFPTTSPSGTLPSVRPLLPALPTKTATPKPTPSSKPTPKPSPSSKPTPKPSPSSKPTPKPTSSKPCPKPCPKPKPRPKPRPTSKPRPRPSQHVQPHHWH